jgi:hypothetical protein
MYPDHQTVNSLKKITKNGRTKHTAQISARGAGIDRMIHFWVDCGGTIWCKSSGDFARYKARRPARRNPMMTATTDTLLYVYPNPHNGKPIEIEVEDPESFRARPDGAHEIVDLAWYRSGDAGRLATDYRLPAR